MKSFVYVISGDHGRQKIGVTDNPRQRIRDLQTGSPFQLRFEFLGEVENGSAGAVEVEAHFMLSPHKSPGGDEWFTVPPDVAITAVMAAAHRLGYRCRPVDPDQVERKSHTVGGRPLSYKIASALSLILFAYFFYNIVMQQSRGELDNTALAVEGFLIVIATIVVRWILATAFGAYAAIWHKFDRAMHPEDGEKVPLPD